MPVRIGAGLSTAADPRVGGIEAARIAGRGLGRMPADLVLVFACGTHLAAPEATLEGVHEALRPRSVIGCGAGGVLGRGREVEDGTAVAAWAIALDGGAVETFHLSGDGEPLAELPALDDATGLILFPAPGDFPTPAALAELAERAPGLPVLGGVASARTIDGSAALLLGDRLIDDGAVGVVVRGVPLVPCVSQGAAPVGPELTITAADGHVIHELAGRPALEKIRAVLGDLTPAERGTLGRGLLVGLVVGAPKPEYGRGDFLVRGLLGADPDGGSIAVADRVRPGQVLRLHARDAGSADRDLHALLDERMSALGGGRPAGALVFSCNGRGRTMFGTVDHDAAALESQLAGAPAAGFFAAGEIGPVGERSFLHGFTATIAIFPE